MTRSGEQRPALGDESGSAGIVCDVGSVNNDDTTDAAGLAARDSYGRLLALLSAREHTP